MAHLKRHHILRLIPTLILILTQLTSHLSSATGCIPTPHTHHYNQLLHNHAHISTPTTPPPPPPHSSLPPPYQPTRFLSLRRKHIYPLPLSTLSKPSNTPLALPLGSTHCPSCHKTFSRPSLLARHLRVHLRDKPFDCQYCRKCFPTKSSRTSYQRLHIGEKPFMCQSYTITITTYHATSTITNDTTVVKISPRISTVPHRLLGAHRLPPHLKPKSYPSSIFTSSFSSTTYYNPTTIISNPPSTSYHSNYMLTTTNSTTLHMHALSSSFDH
nr:zinc finger protein [Hymenolepis microstoma]